MTATGFKTRQDWLAMFDIGYQIAERQIPKDRLSAYAKGRRDEQLAIESLLDSMVLNRTLDIATGHLIMGYIITIDRRPKVEA
jgi:hypothetical protein